VAATIETYPGYDAAYFRSTEAPRAGRLAQAVFGAPEKVNCRGRDTIIYIQA
jgi:hypothetical protein